VTERSPPALRPGRLPDDQSGVFGLVVVLVALTSGCGSPGLLFYDVLRTRTEQCSIRSNGEFCVEPDQFAAPVLEAWAVDLREDGDVLFVAEEAWVLAPLADGVDPWATPRTASRRKVVTAGAALCTTTETTTIEFVADGTTLVGSLRTATRLDGPAACGATPVGERVVEDLNGQVGTP
jgi:hypothetical protein